MNNTLRRRRRAARGARWWRRGGAGRVSRLDRALPAARLLVLLHLDRPEAELLDAGPDGGDVADHHHGES